MTRRDPLASSARPLRTVFTKGTEFEIGQQHAAQLGEDARLGMLDFYGRLWTRLFHETPPTAPWTKPILDLGKRLVDPVLLGQLQRQLPAEYRERLRGVAEAAKVPFAEVHLSVVLPDLLPMLEAFAYKVNPSQFVDVNPPVRFGCSSFVASGDRFWVGRNLDFPGVGYWDKFPIIQVFEKPGKLRYAGFAAAGVPIGGITGINEAQIWVALHQHYCGAFSVRGRLPFVTAEEILGTATTLSEAMEIARRAKMANGWAFVIADGKTREAAIVERQPERVGINRLKAHAPVLAHSNYYQTAHCQLGQYAATARMNWDNYYRKQRLETLVREAGPGMTAAQGVRFLSDHLDTFWQEEKTVNRTVSQLYNIQSVLMDPERMVAYVAEGDSPIHLGNYQQIDIGALFSGRDQRGEVLEGYRFASKSMEAAKRTYIRSFVKCFDGDFEGSLRTVTEAVKQEFVPEMAFAQGLLAMRAGQLTEGKDILVQAKTFIEEKLAQKGYKTPPPEYFEISIFAARALRLVGQETEAHRVFDQVETHPGLQDLHIKKIARERRPFTLRNVQKIVVPYSSYIPFD